MKNPLKNIYLKSRLFIALSVVIVLFVVSFWANEFFTIALLSFMLVVALAVVEALVLFQRKGLLHVKRTLAEQLSLGDENKVHLHLTSNYQIIDFIYNFYTKI